MMQDRSRWGVGRGRCGLALLALLILTHISGFRFQVSATAQLPLQFSYQGLLHGEKGEVALPEAVVERVDLVTAVPFTPGQEVGVHQIYFFPLQPGQAGDCDILLRQVESFEGEESNKLFCRFPRRDLVVTGEHKEGLKENKFRQVGVAVTSFQLSKEGVDALEL